jgi:hypothetical protein
MKVLRIWLDVKCKVCMSLALRTHYEFVSIADTCIPTTMHQKTLETECV